jgi:hypothetical protein
MRNKVSPEVEAQVMKIAKGTQKIGQTKEQTKLIAQGIEKGIAEYKKQHAKKSREMDKLRKQKIKQLDNEVIETAEVITTHDPIKFLPWILLALSWVGFITYVVQLNID